MAKREARAEMRIPIDEFAVSIDGCEHRVVGDVSVNGVGFETGDFLAAGVGDTIDVVIPLGVGEEPARLMAVIRHVEVHEGGGYRVGAEFCEVDVLVENPLYRFVEEGIVDAELHGRAR